MTINRRAISAGLLSCGALVAFTATGSSAHTATTAASKTVNIGEVMDLTGLAAYFGGADQSGINLAIKQAEASGPLKGWKINVTAVDTGTTLTGAVAGVKQIASSNDVALMFGEVSQFAIASMPFAAAANLPTDLAQSGGPGIVTAGPDIFRTTANQVYYQGKLITYLKKQGVKTVAIAYDNQNSTSALIATQTWPQLLASAGIKVLSSDGYSERQTDFSTIASKIASEKPDVMMGSGAAGASTLITQVRQAGFNGVIAGQAGYGGGVLAAIKPASLVNGAVYTVDYTVSDAAPSVKKFTKAYTAAYGKPPVTFAAEGYDQANFILAAIAKVKSHVTRASVLSAMTALARKPFTSVTGNGTIKFVQRDAQTQGLVVKLTDGVETVVGK